MDGGTCVTYYGSPFGIPDHCEVSEISLNTRSRLFKKKKKHQPPLLFRQMKWNFR